MGKIESEAGTRAVIIHGITELTAWAGKEVACSDWVSIDQQRVQQFADVTGDQQWIHTDPERAGRESPFGATVAHGYLTLSLLPYLQSRCVRVQGVKLAVNYGLDRVRFPAPVRVGARVRARISLAKTEAVTGGVQAHWNITVEIEHSDKPACVAQTLARYYAA